MKNKTCELDTIPTNLIKDILLALLKTITQIVTMSLTTGTFPLDWKTAIVRPLIKKAGLELSKKTTGLFQISVFCPSWWSIVC